VQKHNSPCSGFLAYTASYFKFKKDSNR